MKALRGRVEGRVQGVGFRYFTRASALRLGISGYVCNLPDGAVEFFIQGSDMQIESMLNCLKKGPSLARVDLCEYQEVTPRTISSGFVIGRE